jgi:hypothetical protein
MGASLVSRRIAYAVAVFPALKCFYDGNEAVGICKYCGRGVCGDSSVTVGKSTACKGRCEEEVGAQNEMLSRGRKAYARSGGIYRRSALAPALIGILFIGFPVFEPAVLGPMTGLFLGLGIAMLVGAGIVVYNGRRISQP